MATSTAAKVASKSTPAKTTGLVGQLDTKVQTYTATKAFAEAIKLRDSVAPTEFELGAVLSTIQSRGLYAEKGFEKFREYVEDFGIQYRKAMYLIQIFETLRDLEIGWEEVNHVGWTKLRYLVRVFTGKNWKKWVKKAEGLSTIQLEVAVKKSLGTGSSTTSDAQSTEIVTMTFKIHPDQKEVVRNALDKAKEVIKSDHDNQALEALATAYVTGEIKAADPVDPPSLVDLMKEGGIKPVAEALNEVFGEDYEILISPAEKKA